MNLIEQLGGYEKVKSIRDINIKEFDGDASGVTIHYMGNSITQEDLEKSLLEHRRQHNIFEVGDKVVSDFYQLDSLFCVSHVCVLDEFIYSNKVLLDGDVFTTKDKLKGECRFLFEEIRHATDEEIKAGRRL